MSDLSAATCRWARCVVGGFARASMSRLVLVAVLVLLAGCPATPSPPPSVRTIQMAVPVRSSGYGGTPQHWRDFLSCWRRDAQQARLRRDDLGPLLIREVPTGETDISLAARIEARERALGVELPRSYVHFLEAGRPQATWDQIGSGTGLLSIDAIDTAARLDPEGVATAQAHRLDADDTYFVYGVDQDDAVSRWRYQAGAIVVGKYEDSAYAQIVLFPQVRTTDGEMEAALQGWAGSYRAPSFAELMRQLSYFDLGRADHVPPYAQTLLRGSCADRLPLDNIWWK